jgi:CBS domain-containing protein
MTVQDFVDQHLMRTGRRCFLVTQDGILLGLLTSNEIRDIDPGAWRLRTVASVMRPASKVHAVTPGVPARDALETMARDNVHQLPVIVNGKVEGIITRAHVLEAMRSRQELSGITHLPRAA